MKKKKKSPLDSLISPELITQFISESLELLDSIEKQFLEIEQGKSNHSELIESVFRAIHSLKGNAGFMEYQDIVDVCHKAETFLDQLRSDKKQIRKEQISLFLELIDVLRICMELLRNGHSPIITGKLDLLNRLESGFNVDSEISNTLSTDTQNSERSDDLKRSADYREYIRVDLRKIDRIMDLVGEIVISESMISQDPDLQEIASPTIEKSLRNHRKNIDELQELATSMRMVPLTGLFSKLQRLVRDISGRMNKQIDFQLSGGDHEVDRTVIEHISDPLIHLIRNAVDHGIEDSALRRKREKSLLGQISLSARRVGGEIWIELSDDGNGLDRDKILAQARKQKLEPENAKNLPDEAIWRLIFTPGFSTASTITDISGRGVGLDVVSKNIERLRGRIDIESQNGRGSTFTLKIPLTTAIIDGMLIRVHESIYAIPTQDIKQSVHVIDSEMVDLVGGQEIINLRGTLIPILRLERLHKLDGNGSDHSKQIAVIVENFGKEVGFLVHELIGQQQLVIKPMSSYIEKIDGVSGFSVLGNGDICLILDLGTMAKLVETTIRQLEQFPVEGSI
ncbi:MAG: chemotaxis protein CheA [Calditrichaeota bacterium]|nr:chemotaxis protein CheA [Calditrichota bacterium]